MITPLPIVEPNETTVPNGNFNQPETAETIFQKIINDIVI